MNLRTPNANVATHTFNRSKSVVPSSGLCTTCQDGCKGGCEVWLSSFRGREVLYPGPYGEVAAGADKEYPVDYSHLNIQGYAVGAHGLPDGVTGGPDTAIFPAVSTETKYGRNGKTRMRLPIFTGALGSTEIARVNWEHFAIGAAISGITLVCGENVCGIDPGLEMDSQGKIRKSPEMDRRVEIYRRFHDGYGELLIQMNVEDTMFGVAEYVLEKHGIDTIELKWGQGAKDIGGEVKITSLKKAQMLYERGYVVLPNPTDGHVIKAFERGTFKEFERHSRIGMVSEESFAKRVEELRKAGAKYIFLKTGAYRPADLARAVLFATKYKLDLLTVDAAGGGTGMSPWRMMNEWGVPPVELHSLLYKYAKFLADKGMKVPALALAGGFTFEDQIFKGLALGAPFVKLIGMARSPIAAAMVGKTIGRTINDNQIPVYIERFGNNKDEIFVTARELRKELGDEEFEKIPTGALGLYTYYERLAQGLRQLMCGSRKFSLEHVSRDDLACLTHEAANISGIPFITDVDKAEVEEILAG